MLTHPLFPQTFLRLPDAPEGASVADAEVTTPPATVPETATEALRTAAVPATPPPAPWAADLEAAFAAEDPRVAVDTWLREKQQPYITRLEQEKAEAEGKAWVFDGLLEDPEATIREIAAQLSDEDPDIGTRIAELLMEGKTPAAAEATAVAEAAEGEDLSKLDPAIREAVEFARAEKARRAQEDVETTSKKELDEAMAAYDTWRAAALEANPHVVETALHAFVHAADGDMEQGLAAYLLAFPAPEGPVTPAPTTLGGHTTGGVRESRQVSSLGDAFGAVYDAAHKGTTVL